MARPPLSSSRVAMLDAMAPGWRNTGLVIPTANFTFVVCGAAAAKMISGSRATPSSAIHISSTPARSALITASTRSVAGASGYSQIPTRHVVVLMVSTIAQRSLQP